MAGTNARNRSNGFFPAVDAPVDEPTRREPAKRREVTGEGRREASVVAERREEGRRAELVPKTPETSV